MDDPRDVVSVERVIQAPAEKIFDVLARPARHQEIDGSGMVRAPKPDGPARVGLGDTFEMGMHLGVKYSMVNEVIEFEEGRRIAWQAKPKGFGGKIAGGRIWRYELESEDGATLVRESWDVSADKQKVLLRIGPTPKRTRESMEKTLERLAGLVTGSA